MNALLDDLIDNARAFATHVLIDSGQPELGPLFHIIAGDGQNILVVPDFSDEAGKRASLAMIKAKLREVDARAYFSISEAWVVTRSGSQEINCEPRLSEDRREVVICFASTRTDKRAKMWEIVRDDKGAIVALKDDDVEAPDILTGRMADLLEDMGS